MQAPAPAVVRPTPAPFAALFSRWLYMGLVAVMSGVVLAGFWPFYSGLFSDGPRAHWLIHIHAAVFTGWMFLFAAQAGLVLRRRVRSHQALGRFGGYYGLLVLTLGVAVTFVATAENVKAGRMTLDQGAGFLVLPIGDMLLFGGFFGAALVYRRKKEMHKRLMVLATIALMFAPAARIGGESGPFAILAIWLFPLAIVVLHDLTAQRRLERVYLIGTAVLLVAFARVSLMDNEKWIAVGRSMLHPLL